MSLAAPVATRRRRRLLLALLALAVLAAGLAPTSAQGNDQGLGMSPERFTVPTAQPGETYQLTVILQNRRGFEDTIDVALDGEAGAWASTDPAGPFALAAGADRPIVVRIAVPSSAGPGTRDGLIRFTGTASTDPDGTGASVRPSLGLLLNATVGGQATVRLAWLGVRADDAEAGQPVPAFIQVRNDGNVRTTAEATGEVLPFLEDSPVLSSARGSLVVLPGETSEVPVLFPAGLAIGQYRARLTSADGSFTGTDEFKVVAPGQKAPSGTLRVLEHSNQATVGRPVRVDGWFENSGSTGIASARLTLELRRDGELVQVSSSEALAVAAGTHANLTAYVTPDRAGEYTLSGTVAYDGFLTAPRESRLRATAEAGGLASWWWILLVLVVLTLLAWLWAWRKGRRDRQAEERSNGRR